MMRLSVVIPFYNEAESLGAQLNAFRRESWHEPWELVLVNNRSSDGSRALAQAYAKGMRNVRLIDALEKPGAAYARNVGARVARGRALAFCDADDEIGPGWLAAMGAALDRHEFVACRYDTEKLNPAWIRMAYGRHAQEAGLQRLSYFPDIVHAGGSSLGVQRHLHEAIGGFDESWMCLEDTDYCYRLQQRGVTLHFVEHAEVHYRYRTHLWEILTQGFKWALWNARMYHAHRVDARDAWRWRQHAHLWMSLFREAMGVRDKGHLGRVVRLLGWQAGRLAGSLKYRVPPVC